MLIELLPRTGPRASGKQTGPRSELQMRCEQLIASLLSDSISGAIAAL